MMADFHVTTSNFANGKLAEVFVNAKKAGTDISVATRDMAVLISIANQHGASVDELRSAMTRDASGKPEGLAGKLLDSIGDER